MKPAGRSQELADLSERILALWRSAADRGVPEEELTELAGWVSHPDPRIAELAARAVADLEHLRAQIAAESRASDDPESSPGDDGGDLGAGDGSGLRAERGIADRIAAIDQASPKERLEAIRELWRYAADNGSPREALDELGRLAQAEVDPASVALARKAVDDLKALAEQTRSENAAEGGDVASASGESGDLSPYGVAGSLERRYLEEPSPEKRAGLLQPIAASADESAMGLLVEASRDPATPIRHEAINLLWRRAADRPGDAPEILGTLDAAAHDADPGVSATAILAADDLRSLR